MTNVNDSLISIFKDNYLKIFSIPIITSALGILIINIHLLKYNLQEYNILKSQAIFAGFLFIFFSGIYYCFLYYGKKQKYFIIDIILKPAIWGFLVLGIIDYNFIFKISLPPFGYGSVGFPLLIVLTTESVIKYEKIDFGLVYKNVSMIIWAIYFIYVAFFQKIDNRPLLYLYAFFFLLGILQDLFTAQVKDFLSLKERLKDPINPITKSGFLFHVLSVCFVAFLILFLYSRYIFPQIPGYYGGGKFDLTTFCLKDGSEKRGRILNFDSSRIFITNQSNQVHFIEKNDVEYLFNSN